MRAVSQNSSAVWQVLNDSCETTRPELWETAPKVWTRVSPHTESPYSTLDFRVLWMRGGAEPCRSRVQCARWLLCVSYTGHGTGACHRRTNA